MKPVETFIVLVDSHRTGSLYRRHTAGRYRVGAKTAKEAEQILRKEIKFGSIRTYYQCSADDTPRMKYKEIFKEI